MVNPMILVAAVADNQVIGNKGQIPWSTNPDIPKFQELKPGYPVVMGAGAYQSRGRKPIPFEKNFIVTQQYDLPTGGYSIFIGDLESQLAMAGRERFDGKFYVIGGSQIYRQTIDRASRLEITHVHQKPEGDAYFPEIDPGIWMPQSREDHGNYSFVSYVRK